MQCVSHFAQSEAGVSQTMQKHREQCCLLSELPTANAHSTQCSRAWGKFLRALQVSPSTSRSSSLLSPFAVDAPSQLVLGSGGLTELVLVLVLQPSLPLLEADEGACSSFT